MKTLQIIENASGTRKAKIQFDGEYNYYSVTRIINTDHVVERKNFKRLNLAVKCAEKHIDG